MVTWHPGCVHPCLTLSGSLSHHFTSARENIHVHTCTHCMYNLYLAFTQLCALYPKFYLWDSVQHRKFLFNLVNSLPNRVQLCRLAIHLVCSRKQKHLGVLFTFEFWMILVCWITEVFNFGHCKLSANKNIKLKLNILKSDVHYIAKQTQKSFHCPVQDRRTMKNIAEGSVPMTRS